MKILRSIFYFFHSLFINIFVKNVRVSLTSQIKPRTTFGSYVRIGDKSYLKGSIGDYSYIGNGCMINARIGKFCSIASNVKIIDASHPINLISTSPVFYSKLKQCGFSLVDENQFNEISYADESREYSCIIGNDVWVGENVLIKGGLKIGNGSIIAMGAVVTKDVPPYSIFGGVPAKELKKRFSDNKINSLQESQWWDKPQLWLIENRRAFLVSDEDISNFCETSL